MARRMDAKDVSDESLFDVPEPILLFMKVDHLKIRLVVTWEGSWKLRLDHLAPRYQP